MPTKKYFTKFVKNLIERKSSLKRKLNKFVVRKIIGNLFLEVIYFVYEKFRFVISF